MSGGSPHSSRQRYSFHVLPLRRLLLLGLLALFLAPLVCAYDVALKNGSIIHFQKYRVADNKLIYLSKAGEELSVNLSDINLTLTRQLNAKADPPLALPGLTGNTAPPRQPPAPLGDVARQLNLKPEIDPQGRVFTNDDFPSSPVPPAPAKAAPSAPHAAANAAQSSSDWSASKAKIERFLSNTGQLTEQQYAARMLGPDLADIQFPNRPAWQTKIYAEHQRYLADAKLCISDRVADEGRPQDAACSRLDSDKYAVQSSRDLGKQLAQDWASRQDKFLPH